MRSAPKLLSQLVFATTLSLGALACADGETADPADPNGSGKGDGTDDDCPTLSVEALDIWAQPLRSPTIAIGVTNGSVAGLCEDRALTIEVEAPLHHTFAAELDYSDGELTVAVSNAGADAAWLLTRDGDDYVLWVGLTHRFFAAEGRPARHGNDVRLLMDGQEAWGAVATDLKKARGLVTGSTWWWTSDMELVRDPARHMSSTLAERRANTVLGMLEALPVEKKVMVGQFVGQDGWFSDITVDDGLLAHAEKGGDRFEYMGEANPAAGDFDLVLPPVDFATRVYDTFLPSGDYAGDVGLAPFRDTIAVAASDVPLVSGFDVPIASWHQKFWTVDQRIAFIGGMNAKTTDWDTSAHKVFDPLRMELEADANDRAAVAAKDVLPDFGPRKDYMVRVNGPSAIDAVDVFHARWQYQRENGNQYAAYATPFEVGAAPGEVPGVQAQVIATMPAPYSENAIFESVMRAVEQAERYIYIEDQYFRAPILYDAIVRRMDAVPGLVLVVVTKPVSEWVDPGCWQTAIAHERFKSRFPNRYRIYQLRAFDYVRTDCTFCQDETEAHFVDIDTHSKIVIIDDLYLQTGSCNSNNRGLLYEGELAVAVVDQAWVSAQRKRIFANLLGPGAADVGMSDIVRRFDELANRNQQAYVSWEKEGMDLDLDGDALPASWQPTGFLYPLSFDSPGECALEDVGADAT